MRLHAVSKRFDTTLVADAYNPTVTFKAQFEPMSFSKVDGVAIKKRQLSVAPDVTVPTRGALAINGEIYLVGHPAPDFWNNKVIRQTLIIQGADGVSAIRSIAEALGDLPGVAAYAAAVFSKYNTDERTTSAFHPQYQLFFAGSEEVAPNDLVQLGSAWYLVKESYRSTSGLSIALANKIDGSVFETVTVSSNTYDPVADTNTSVTTSLKVMRVRYTEDFEYLTEAQTDYVRADETLTVLKSAWPDAKPSDTLALSDGSWRVLAVADHGSTLALHTRRV